jgi:hypothetical protein
MVATATIVGSAVTVGKALYSTLGYNAEVIITNETSDALLHHTYYAGHGDIVPSGNLPAIAPWYPSADDPSDHLVFQAAVTLSGKRAPAVVMEWKFASREMYLLVFAYLGGAGQQNAGFFQLLRKPIEPSTWWENNVEKSKTWFYHGDVNHHCDMTLDGIRVTGEIDNGNPAEFSILLTEAQLTH